MGIANIIASLLGAVIGILMIPFGFSATTWQAKDVAQPAPVYRCDSITIKKEPNGEIYRIDVKTTVTNGVDITGYVFDFGNDGLIATETPYMLAAFGQTGQREVRVLVIFEIGEPLSSFEVDTCQAPFTIPNRTP